MLQVVTDFLWSYVLVVVLIGIGLVFTVGSRFVQIRHFAEMFRVLRQAFHHQPGHVSSFQALALSVAGRVGAGNIAGVAVAITLGGPGAIFWMWVIGLIGMSTSFFECTLAQVFKNNEPDGTYRGGPAYYMVRGAKKRWLATVYSVLLLLTFGMAFVGLQSFTAASSLEDAFGIPALWTGIGLTAVVGAAIFGGVKRIASVTEIVVPVMAVSYIIIAVVVVLLNLDRVPGAFSIIFTGAFGLDEAIGGGIGAAIMMGARRGCSPTRPDWAAARTLRRSPGCPTRSTRASYRCSAYSSTPPSSARRPHSSSSCPMYISWTGPTPSTVWS